MPTKRLAGAPALMVRHHQLPQAHPQLKKRSPMYDKKLARSILERLEQAFPERLHLHDLKVALPDFEAVPARDWLVAIQALRLDGKIDGAFLPGGDIDRRCGRTLHH
jgi:hypothetical protein